MKDFKIEKDIPAPDRTGGRARKYPFNIMKEGDSFYVDGYSPPKMQSICSSGRAFFARENTSLTVMSKKEDDGFRVWVIKKATK